ncbi:mycothiol synthase [Jatrophihabitans sp.]|uniref:mycothiol synthase n=1 Tax=Jatrophihabitans sp. TaxID=1932789 RepID=UPI002D1B11DC|nr:mycothiol synthase [Jatrophihabitans sp.]
MTAPISDVAVLSPELVAAISTLARQSPDAADTPPLSEQALLRLTAGPPVRHLVYQQAYQEESTLLGYAQLEPGEHTCSVELVATDPLVATELLEAAGRLVDPASLRLWAHGRNSVAAQAGMQAGWQPVRTLLQLRVSLDELELGEPRLPDGVSIRPFRPGFDEQAWLAVNARAFAAHPEQGRWTLADLEDRLAAPWFDSAGFLLAVRADGQLLGYHWTKVHTETPEPMGEVYVLGVDPDAQGLSLGRALLVAGLRYLRERDLGTVLLYVEADNTPARALYEGLGFTVFARDIQFAAG